MSSFDDFISVVEDDEFEEEPVPLDVFLYSDSYLGLPEVSDYQFKLIESLTQIYKYETLMSLWGEEEADRLWKSTHKEVIFQLGKGSGKDYTTGIAFARIIYLLLCLKDPAKYYGKPSGDAIALLNVAVNAKQAKEVFFNNNLKKRITGCPWFNGRYDKPKVDEIHFDKSISAYSGHSEREAWEGYNLIIAVLDEIAAFESEAEILGSGSNRSKTADAIYKMYKASVRSRFPKFGKLALLSFPRYKGDFIQQRYEKVIADKHTEIRQHQFKIHPDLGDHPDNLFTIEWEEDHILSYTEPDVYALRRPTWDVNPTIDIEDYKTDFYDDKVDALSRYACMPPDAVDAFFKDVEQIERAFPEERPGPFMDNWAFKPTFKPDREKEYFLHVDLGYTHDRASVAMCHVKEWKTVSYPGGDWSHHSPVIVIDAVRYWTPLHGDGIKLDDVQEYILSLIRRGFKISLVTFDKWNSVGYRQRLKDDYGVNTDLLSVAKPHYEELKTALTHNSVLGYYLPVAVEELKQLRVIRGNKVDHPRKGSKDVSDAIAGAVFNAIANSDPDVERIIEVEYLEPAKQEKKEEPPKPEVHRKMPRDLEKYLESMKTI